MIRLLKPYCYRLNSATCIDWDIERGTIQPFYGYGLDVKNYSQRRLINAGPHNGFRILLNVNQSEYCGAGRKWSGAGFKAIVHDPGVKPWFVLEPTLSFSPGFDTNVVLKPTVFNRRTSNLGRCSDFVFLHLNPEATKYFKSACYQQCFTEYVWKQCKCFPTTAYRNQKDVYINKEKVNITKFCWGESMTCLLYAEEHFLQNNPDAACPICEEPCIDTKYEFEVSSLLFPSDHLAEMYAEELHTKVELLEDNFVVVNFHYESMNMRVIDETQAFTLLDLFTYFGGIIGLFLGMSIMSLAEVLHQIRITAKKKMREKRMKEQLTTNVVAILSKQRLVDAKSLSSEKKLVFLNGCK
uniref:Uncharacterized protein n=1 Tax=Romanomermis culicivorax TaxID=13658 RepID=A0A915HY92_ROMCU